MTWLWPSLLSLSRVVQPDTILRWHRAGFRAYWRWRSRGQQGRPNIARDLRELIRQMSREKAPQADTACRVSCARALHSVVKAGILIIDSDRIVLEKYRRLLLLRIDRFHVRRNARSRPSVDRCGVRNKAFGWPALSEGPRSAPGQTLHFCDVRVMSVVPPIAAKWRTCSEFG